MTSDFDFQFNAQYRQDELLAEAASRRLARPTETQRDEPAHPAGSRLQTLLRRLAGAPTFA